MILDFRLKKILYDASADVHTFTCNSVTRYNSCVILSNDVFCNIEHSMPII